MQRKSTSARPVRCAVYTRKSVRDGLELEVNSLEVQRDICSAYIRSQRHRQWVELPNGYDDGGYTGGDLKRPNLARLLIDVEQGLVDVVVIYKLDRLTRSLSDFIRLIDLFDQYDVTFVSVTQAFDTQDSLGRLVLNILLTFAQFEREMLADRIRDKAHALRRAGRWIGGAAPFGYDLVEKRLVPNAEEAAIVRTIHERYLDLQSSNKVTREMAARGMLSKAWTTRSGARAGGRPVTQSLIYGILGNPIYLGEFHVDGEVIKALHQPIVDPALFAKACALKEARRLKKPPSVAHEHLLLGFAFDEHGRRMVISEGVKQGTSYRYYMSTQNHRLTKGGLKALRAGATDLEELVRAAICAFLRNRGQVSVAMHSLGHRDGETERLIDRGSIGARWLETFERRRLRRAWEALIERVELSRERVLIVLRCEQIRAFLAWPGTGALRLPRTSDAKSHRVHSIEAQAFAVRSERQFKLPLDVGGERRAPKRGLVELLSFAREEQRIVYEEREPVDVVARRFRRRPTFISRALRLNYLAPDILAAIVDGRQPPDLTRKKLLTASIPMDWAQQRALFGFSARQDPSPNDQHY